MVKNILLLTTVLLFLNVTVHAADTIAVIRNEVIDDNKDDTSVISENKTGKLNKNSDTTRIRVGKKSISIIEDGEDTYYKVMDSKDDKEKNFDFEIEDDEMRLKKRKTKNKFEGNFAGFEIGLNTYGNTIYSTSLNKGDDYMELNSGESVNWNINFMQHSIPFTNNSGIVTGFGLEFNSYSFANNNTIVRDSIGVIQPFNPNPGKLFDYSKLKTAYLTVPLILEFQIPTSTKKNKPVHIGAGLIGGLKIGSKTKYKYSDSKQKTKYPGDYNLSPFRYGLTFRAGYRSINLYSNVYLTPLFERKGPQLYPFSIGITLIPF